MKCEETRRVAAPGGASPRGLISPSVMVPAAEAVDFRHRAGAVLARRNRRVLAMASAERPVVLTKLQLRRIGARQKMQLELLMGRGAL